MKTEELLEKHPKVTSLIKQWMTDKMIDSIDLGKEVPEEFKEYMRKETIEEKNLIPIIDANPKILIDFFDIQGLHISSGWRKEDEMYICTVEDYLSTATDRKKAESIIIKDAFDILEEKL